jgi:hypothetical protein
MSSELSLKEIDRVLSGGTRTPLNVAFSTRSAHMPARTVNSRDLRSKSKFNAVGSLAVYTDNKPFHLPVIDVDGGAMVQSVRKGSKVVVNAEYDGELKAESMLRDVLGDNGIDLEIFAVPAFYFDRFSGRGFSHMDVGAITLRSAKKDVFVARDSTSQGHSHLYIEQAFSPEDHTVLLQELGAIGVISPGWLEMTENEGMGIVRTPWTKKEFEETDL